MADSFNGTTIRVRINPALSDKQGIKFHVHEIPGGDVQYLDAAGKKERTIQLPLHFTSIADSNTIKAMQGTSATLVCILGTISSATLTDFHVDQVVPNKSGGISAVLATGVWTVP